jgi:hypothetical protein
MTRFRTVAFLTLFGLPTTINAQQPVINQTNPAYLDCLRRAVNQIDDQKSDASIIAQAILPMCAQEYAANRAAFGRRTTNPVTEQQLLERMDAAKSQVATGIVLKARDSKAKSN